MTEAVLNQLIDEGIRENAPNEVIVEILKQYSIQQPLDFGKISEVDPGALANFINNDGTFANASSYKIRLTGFGIFDSDGNQLVQLNADGSVTGYLPYSFRMPSDSEEDEKNFRELCNFLNRKFDAVNYPIIPTTE